MANTGTILNFTLLHMFVWETPVMNI
jgi:hypothetical protein